MKIYSNLIFITYVNVNIFAKETSHPIFKKKNLYEARMPFKKKISNLIFDIEK